VRLVLVILALFIVGCGKQQFKISYMKYNTSAMFNVEFEKALEEIEVLAGDRFLHTKEDEADFWIVVSFGDLPPQTLGLAQYGDNCTITLIVRLDKTLQNRF
jgi:hypothetical protein